MEIHKTAEQNRIARDMATWKRVEDKLTERYGRKIVYDRDFLKAKRDIFKHIRDKHKTRPLNLFEKAEMRVLRGQHRNLLRQIYPNPFVRLTRNVLVFAGNSIAIAFRAIARAGNTLFPPQPAYSSTTNATRLYARDPQTGRYKSLNDSQQQLSANGTTQNNAKALKRQQQTEAAVSQAKAIVRKLPVKHRVQMPATQSKGMRR